MLNNQSDFNAIFKSMAWPDASLESVEEDYESLTLCLLLSNDNQVRVRFENHIHYEHSCFWDENIIESAEVVHPSPLVEDVVKQIEAAYGAGARVPGGKLESIQTPLYHARIRFNACTEINVIAAAIKVTPVNVP